MAWPQVLRKLLGAEKEDGFTSSCPERRKHAKALSGETTGNRQEVRSWQHRTKEVPAACGRILGLSATDALGEVT